jgi:hypothetical protein
MATLQTQYQNYLKENPTSKLTYDEWIDQVWLLNKLNKQEPPFVSDDFQIGPDGAFELGDDVSDWDDALMDGVDIVDEAKSDLIHLLETQIIDLVMMSKIELGDDVIAEIARLKAIINEN